MLDKDAVKAIERILASGFDVELRKKKYGVTIASVGKKVVYKEPGNKRELSEEPKRG